MNIYKKFLPHVLAVVFFVIAALTYFYPVLSGKQILQSDIVQYTAMAKEQNDFRAEHQQETYWTNSAFAGMPTYQLGAKYPHNYIKKLDQSIRFLPRPADYLFLYFIGFYLLLCSLKVRPLLAVIGALAFGFSTYLIVIIGAGHNAKAHAIAYMPMVLAGFLMIFKRNYLWGGLITMFSAALEINANHFQMTYYLLLCLAIVTLYYFVIYIKTKQFKELLKISCLFLAIGLFALGSNATNLLATKEYADFSTRSKSELTLTPEGDLKQTNDAMTFEYITEYSYGPFESLNLFVPRLTGGGNNENIGSDSHLGKFLAKLGARGSDIENFTKHAPTYWANQPIVAAPAYIGAVVLALFVLALFIEKRKIKLVFIATIILSILFSWGHHLFLTPLLIDYLPLYNKFRAVSSIQVLAELCIPLLAILGLHSFLNADKKPQIDALKKSSLVFIALFGVLILGYWFSDFKSENDVIFEQIFANLSHDAINELILDRKELYLSDLFRSFALVCITFIVLFVFNRNKISQTIASVAIGFFIVFDLVSLDKNYVNKEQFVARHQVENPFSALPSDELILKDTSHFRVFEKGNTFNSARASYFHHSVGGYHAAKPKKIQELMDYQLSKGNIEILNMLNVKYIIDNNSENPVTLNENANGNAWFVNQTIGVSSADYLMEKLKNTNTKSTAIFKHNKSGLVEKTYPLDSLANLKVKSYQSNKIVYSSSNNNDGLAVFSEIFYPKGWKASIDGKQVKIHEVDYTLRALEIPKGNHQIVFEFIPQVVKTGSRIALISFTGMMLVTMASLGYFFYKNTRYGN